MNTPKYNIEQQIKKQIDEREINPSRDLWGEIESQTATQTSSKSKINWLLIAACLALIFSLGSVLMFNKDEIVEPQIAETKVQPEITQPEIIIEPEISPLIANKTEIVIKGEVAVASQNFQIAKSEVVVAKPEVPLIKVKQDQIIPEVYKNQISHSIAAIDSAKVPAKRKKYVDASTLLFSVEHKDVIENSKGGSNVATIDLNTP